MPTECLGNSDDMGLSGSSWSSFWSPSPWEAVGLWGRLSGGCFRRALHLALCMQRALAWTGDQALRTAGPKGPGCRDGVSLLTHPYVLVRQYPRAQVWRHEAARTSSSQQIVSSGWAERLTCPCRLEPRSSRSLRFGAAWQEEWPLKY